jgi:hypothetical protein
MKKLIFFLMLLVAVTFYSCVDTEEHIVINADNSGSYTLKIDMSKMMELLNQMGGASGKAADKPGLPTKDTIMYFKDMQLDKLTAEERALYKDGYLKVRADSVSNQFKIEAGCPFANINQLPEIRKNIFKISEKLGADKAMKADSNLPDEEAAGADEDIAGKINPTSNDYAFTASPGKLSYKSIKPAGSAATPASDSLMQMMQQMSMLTGDMTIKTIITLPAEPKKLSNPKAQLSADKRTITFTSTLIELMEKPGLGEYEIEY